ncbi:MAG TPA: ABC transporter permease [Candidatus Acidoferrum sp.]|nr:ABC transporter permease [Candidatus Acidoferrum sp.]
METLGKDLRYAFRMLVKSPGFSLIAVLALALGIGANTAIFSVFDGMLWRPLPAKNPHELVVLAAKTKGFEFPINMSYPDFLDYRNVKQAFADVAAEVPSPVNLSVDGRAERAWTEFVSGNFFSMLGLQAARGRTFAPDEGWVKGKDPLMVLSYKFWQQRFAGDPGVIGRSVQVDKHPFTIIGVAPREFHGTYYFIEPDFYLPVTMIPVMALDSGGILENRNENDFRILARLQPGVTPEQAKAAAAPTNQRLAQEYPDSHKDFSLYVAPELKARPEPGLGEFMSKVVIVFMSLVGLVLLIACANVANLILARANARRKEIATRTALGASPWRMVRQLLTESVVLALVGGIAGLLLARWAAVGLMSVHVPTDIPLRLFDLRMDYRIFGFCFAVALLTGILAGIIPALRTSRSDLAETLKEGGRSGGASATHNRLRNTLVVGQVAVSLLLLAGAGFFVRSFQNSARVDMGFRTANTLMVSMDLRLQGYTDQRGQQFYEQLRDRVKTRPGVRDAAISSFIPMGYENSSTSVFLPGQISIDKSQVDNILFNSVQPEYFRTAGVPVIQGREFAHTDTATSPRVAIVNEEFAKKIFPGQDPIGKVFQSEKNGPAIQVVGLTRTGKYLFLYEPALPYVYFPMTQNYHSSAVLFVYSEGDPLQVVEPVREEVRALDPTLPLYDVTTMEAHVRYGKPLLPARLGAMLVGAFGLLGLALASVGVYGVISYSVSQRTQELGIRAALGARPGNVISMVLRQGISLSLIGIGIGLVLAFLLLRAMRSVLYGVGSTDIPTLATVSVLLLLVAFVATYIPALRATRVDPVIALRHE